MSPQELTRRVLKNRRSLKGMRKLILGKWKSRKQNNCRIRIHEVRIRKMKNLSISECQKWGYRYPRSVTITRYNSWILLDALWEMEERRNVEEK